jgi:hypothetical protein
VADAASDELLAPDRVTVALTVVLVDAARRDELVALAEPVVGLLRASAEENQVAEDGVELREVSVGLPTPRRDASAGVEPCPTDPDEGSAPERWRRTLSGSSSWGSSCGDFRCRARLG